MTDPTQMFMLGALVTGLLLVSIKFWKFWRVSGDELFVWFGTAFVVFAVSWAVRAIEADTSEHVYHVYIPRLLGFTMILIGIYRKNRRGVE